MRLPWAPSLAPALAPPPILPRGCAPAMLEAYDMLPLLNCLDEADVGACLETLNPHDGRVLVSEAAGAAFIGGSVGVIGTVISAFVKRDQVKDRLKCTYCNGTGQIVCGRCYGNKVLELRTTEGSFATQDCGTCESTGTVVCINCQGSGVQVGFTEEDYIGLFDEVKFPDFNELEAPQYSSDQQKAAVEDRARLGALSYGGGKPSSPKEEPLEAPPLDSMG
ncbi:hypothetical protein EMIHUDRAFT_315551 [Emiliania huxleyi CCMP1516]|uniref:Uncharacterized protein n=2 Tax=Emiliania huxleyi TaxID=2903 RepID=A0A0D3JJE7_EMIH1|nr:hypothetical protein EMIHUDRAFT_315551 [Emiliania huxleyi CCMP1516]EOD23632.1 hypothetical protein EMIHUDRAFT_315551 [Emiliania huxleyi CCMP1516]|eukprot:XP_005776061.1 hypothetical protein EMIHUDRAFT_315551 [Emiliania huxleyi CCMP1516]